MTPALYINTAGMMEAVDAARGPEVEALGWVPASAEQAKDYFLAQKYGTTGQAAIAGLESFGSMLTFGGSTWLEKAAGVDTEGIAAREKFNPLASGAGSTAGIVLPLLFTGGGSAAAQGAKATAPSILARLGGAATKAAERALPAAESLAGRLTRRGLAAAAGGAVEGAGYEVGQLVHESALGDPNLTAEAALARIGVSAATFGALSGGGGILGQLTKEAGAALGSGGVREKLSGWLEDLEARSAGKAAGGIQSDIKKLRQKLGGEGANAVMRDIGEMGLVDWYTTPQMTAERSQALMDRAGATMGEVVKSADAIAGAEGAALGDLGGVLKRARAQVLKPLEGNPYQKEAASKLGALLDDLEASGRKVTLEDLHGFRQMNDQALYGMRGTMDPYATAYRQGLHDLRGLYSEAIEAGIEKSGVPLDIWKTASREYQVGATALEFAEKGIERNLGNNVFGLSSALWGGVAGTLAGGPIGGISGTLATEATRRFGSGALYRAAKGLRGLLEGEEAFAVANRTAEGIAAERQAVAGGAAAAEIGAAARATAEPETAAALAALEKAKRGVTEEIDGALKTLLSNAPRAVARAAQAKAADLAAEAVQARLLGTSPDLLMDALARQTDDLHGHAPSVAQAAQMASARAAAFLASKAPGTPPATPGAPPMKPSAHALAKFGRYREVALRPLQALEHAKRGTLTPEHVEALRGVYPALYSHIQEQFLWAMMGHKGTLSPFSRMMGAMLTGFNMGGLMGYNPIAANQAAFARPNMQGPQNGPMPNPNAGALKEAGRVGTPTQRADARMEKN